MRRFSQWDGLVFCGLMLLATVCQGATPDERAAAFVQTYEAEIRPLELIVHKAWWAANTTGNSEDFAAKEEAQNRLNEALSNAKAFDELKSLRDAKLSDPLLTRQINVLYRNYLDKQVPPDLLVKITAKSNAIEKAFNVYRGKVGDESLSDSQVRKILINSTDSKQRQAAWEASKGVGTTLAADLIELVHLRNESARRLGFKNFHELQFFLNEQSSEQVLTLFDRLDAMTREPFLAAKGEIDEALAKAYGIAPADLRPWHYHDPFFQEAPAVFGVKLDAPFEHANLQAICQKFYAGIDLPIDDVLQRSDLFERPGKNPHAFCTDIDREGDVRVLANVTQTEQYMGTLLHELGHSVYSSKNIPRTVPYVLRGASHTLTTEGIAMMFERFSKNSSWLTAMGVEGANTPEFARAAARARRHQLLIFSRWCQVMLRFEKGLYEDPDQDLNRLWWDLVEKYQGLHRPDGRNEPDYASKIHIVSAPAYYHNYMLGQLFACQVHAAICEQVLHASDPSQAYYFNQPEVGRFLRERVFAPGRTLSWDELTQHATGRPLEPQAFTQELLLLQKMMTSP